MSSEQVHKIADAVLYEGYLLYPYRPSSLKNRQRWTFGGLYPPSFAGRDGDSSRFETQLLIVGANALLEIELRFLHLRARQQTDGTSWQEAHERSIVVSGLSISDLLSHSHEERFAFSASSDAQCRSEAIQGTIEVLGARAGGDVYKVSIVVSNRTPVDLPEDATRDEASLHALISAHAIVGANGGEFISLTDPPETLREVAADCCNAGVWPVLAGDNGAHDCMLVSPIVLPDYPQIAPESAGDLFDSSEIDEILTLRILTMTDAEKEEMRNTDARARRILERTEALAPEQLMNLHGVLRNPHAGGLAAGSER